MRYVWDLERHLVCLEHTEDKAKFIPERSSDPSVTPATQSSKVQVFLRIPIWGFAWSAGVAGFPEARTVNLTNF